MAPDPLETREWSRTHKASWELLPLVEMHANARVQVGFHLELSAQIPPGLTPEERERAGSDLWDRLREVAESLATEAGVGARLEVEPFDSAGRLRPETGFAPEVLLVARVINSSDYFTPVDEEDRRRLKPMEVRLHDFGFRERHW